MVIGCVIYELDTQFTICSLLSFAVLCGWCTSLIYGGSQASCLTPAFTLNAKANSPHCPAVNLIHRHEADINFLTYVPLRKTAKNTFSQNIQLLLRPFKYQIKAGNR